MTHLKLPLPPSLNNYYTRDHRLTKAAREYRQHCVDNLPAIRANIPLSLVIHLVPPDRRRRDVDNILKCLLDALTHAKVYEDDSLIYKLQVFKHPPQKNNGHVVVQILPAGEMPPLPDLW